MGFQSAQLFIIIYSQLFVAGLATTTHYIVPRQKNNKKKHDTPSVCPVKIVSKSGLQTLHEMTCIRGYNESVYVMCTERYTGVY